MLPNLSDFQAQMDTQFEVALADGAVYPLTLVEAAASSARGKAPHLPAPFQLKFRGPGPGYLPQMTYPLRHDGLGGFELFLVPIGTQDGGFLYQAVFN